MSWSFNYVSNATNISSPSGEIKYIYSDPALTRIFKEQSISGLNNCMVYPYMYIYNINSKYGFIEGSSGNTHNKLGSSSPYLHGIQWYHAALSSVNGGQYTDDDYLFFIVRELDTNKVYAARLEATEPGVIISSVNAGPGYYITQLPSQDWVNVLDAVGIPTTKMIAAAWTSLQSLSVPTTTTTTLSSANSTKSTAQGYWNTISQAGSGWSNYSAAQSKYNEIVTAVSNIEARDTRLNKKADKTELNASNSKVRVEYTTPHTKGTADYTSIKSTLTSVNNRLNS